MRLAFKIIALAGLATLAGIAFVAHRATARETAIAAAFPPLGQIITVNGRAVHVLVQGSGPDLVLIHGASGNLRDFSFALIDQLADHYRVMAFDRPGLGYSAHSDDRYASAFSTRAETLSEQADLLQAAAAQLGATRPIVLGQSYGGAVALAWAVHHPDAIAALVAVSAPSNPWEGGLGRLYAIIGSALGGAFVLPLITAFAPDSVVEQAIAGVFAPNPVPPGYVDYIGAQLVIRGDSGRTNARQINALLAEIIAMVPDYGNLTLPVEIVHGDLDTVVPLAIHSARLVHEIPGAVLTVLPGVGHMPHHTDPQAVIDAVDRAARRAGLR